MKSAKDYARHARRFAERAGVEIIAPSPPPRPPLYPLAAAHNAMLHARRAARLARIMRREKTRDDDVVGALRRAAFSAAEWTERAK